MKEQPEKQLICPECGNGLKQVYAEANYGRVLLLDQCDTCGGIWFDSWELYYLRDAETKRLDSIDTNKLFGAIPSQNGAGLCPQCSGATLEPFQDPNLPADSKIHKCPACNGLWLNRGELIKYENHKAKVRSRFETAPASTKGAEAVAAVNSQQAKWETVSRLSAALRVRPEPDVNALSADDTNWDRREMSKDALFLILQILFKIIFKI